MASVEVTRTYLRLKPVAALARAPLPDGVRLLRRAPCTVDEYRAMYAEVGAPWHWHDRDAWPDEQLAAHLADPTVVVWRLEDRDARFLGYVELQRHPDQAVEIVYFGLVPAATGRGIGKGFLTAAVDAAVDMGGSHVWLHTCTLDHPAAQANYMARGFTPYASETYVQELIEPSTS
jgi:RimJ/RimL family protein N-acetyltransferase